MGNDEGHAKIEAWRVHDTGLVAAPGPFRRLAGAVRHHQGRGEPWPDRVTIEVTDTEVIVTPVATWPRAEVTVEVMGEGPPVTFVVRVGDAAHLLAAAADPGTRSTLAALSDRS